MIVTMIAEVHFFGRFNKPSDLTKLISVVIRTATPFPLYAVSAARQKIVSRPDPQTPLVPTLRSNGDETEAEINSRAAILQVNSRTTTVR